MSAWPVESPVIRPAAAGDAGGIARVHVASWQAAYCGLLPDAYLDRLAADEPDRERTWRNRIQHSGPGEVVLVAARGHGIVGFSSAGPTRDRGAGARTVGEVYAVYLVPEEWGRGGGRLLLEAAVTALAAAGFAEATLWVLETNARARRFYEHLGWITDGSTKQERFGATVTEVRYVLAIRSPV